MTALHPAPRELAAYAAATAGWDLSQTADAILAAGHAGWAWEQVDAEVHRLMRTQDGSPAGLLAACRRPDRPPPLAGPSYCPDGRPDETKPGGADYRAALAEVRAKASRDARALGHDTSTGGTL